jgi:hypothetical protein
MRLDLYVETSRQFQNPSQSLTRLKRLKIEEEIREPMATSQPAVLPAAIKAIKVSLFS